MKLRENVIVLRLELKLIVTTGFEKPNARWKGRIYPVKMKFGP